MLVLLAQICNVPVPLDGQLDRGCYRCYENMPTTLYAFNGTLKCDSF